MTFVHETADLNQGGKYLTSFRKILQSWMYFQSGSTSLMFNCDFIYIVINDMIFERT